MVNNLAGAEQARLVEVLQFNEKVSLAWPVMAFQKGMGRER